MTIFDQLRAHKNKAVAGAVVTLLGVLGITLPDDAPQEITEVVEPMSCERATEVVNSILRSTTERDLTTEEEAAYAVFQTCPVPMEPVVSKTIEVPKIPAYVTEWKACDTGPCKRRQIRKCAEDTGKTKEECRDEVNK